MYPKKKFKIKTISYFLGWASLFLLVLLVPGWAEELSEGTTISAANLEQLKESTFEGEKIKDLLPESLQTWMKEGGLTMRLAHSKELILPPKYIEATKANAGKTIFDPKTKMVSHYVAGMPFPDIQEEDPTAGYKLIWNWTLAPLVYGDTLELGTDTRILHLDRGYERGLTIQAITVTMQGRTSLPPTTIDPNILKKQAVVFIAPNDVAGLGQYFIRYSDGRPDDSYAYIKSIRRVRRVSGGSWMDPVPSLDQLYDDYFALDSHPSWYKDIKLVGKRKILCVLHGTDPNQPHKTEDRVNLANKPYGAPINQPWEVREVYAIEITPPDTHPYSRKIVYMDTQAPIIYFADAYDRKGDFWKIVFMLFTTITMADGQPGIADLGNGAVDFQRRHENYVDLNFVRTNNARIKSDEVDMNLLVKGAAGGAGILQK